jgi:hypothetical protein
MSDTHEYQHNKVISRVASAAFSDATSAIFDTHSAVKTLAITVTLEAVAIAMFIIAKDKVAEMIDNSPDDFWFYGGAVFFFNGFFFAFAGYTLLANRWPQRRARIFLWILSFAVGALNLLVFFALSAMATG